VIREPYDALAALRNKGVLARRVPRSKSPFVAVRVTPSAPSATPTMQALPSGDDLPRDYRLVRR
jgi:hypothetical protein